MIDVIAMFPVLVAENLAAQNRFYSETFGFQAVFFDEDFYLHLLHPEGAAQLAFMVPNHPSQPVFLHPLAGSEGMVISMEVQDARAAWTSASQAGLERVLDYTVEPFGQTHFMLKDPAGFIVDVVENHPR